MAGVPRHKLLTRWGQLKSERASFIPHWMEISTMMLPRAGRFFVTDRNRGERRHHSIYDSTGTRALGTLAAGMMAGMTSPARPWFKLETPDRELNAYAPVKLWLHEVSEMMRTVFRKSNTYRALHSIYGELGAFGTAANLIVSDFDNVIHNHPLTVGEYAIATDEKGNVNTLFREFQMTVSQVVRKWGAENTSVSVRRLFETGMLDSWVTVIHAIEPREDRDTTKRDAKNMRWKSCYFLIDQPDGQYLSESGFARFPGVAPRWETRGGDVYGESPAMTALGDVKQLQHEQLRKATVIDKKTNPPLQVPSTLKGRDVDYLPGGLTYVDTAGGQNAVRSLYDVNLDLSHLLEDIRDVRERINSTFYADMFLMLANSTNPQMTATEVAERHEEKLLMLGPVLERLHNELVGPLIDVTFDRMAEAGILPPPPPELRGMDLGVEFISMLAQAQRAIGVNSIDRFTLGLGQIAAIKPEALDRLDADQWVDEYADSLGISPKLIVPIDVAKGVREARAQQQKAAQQAASMEQMAGAAQKLGATPAPSQEQTALSDAIGMFSGYTG